MGPVIEQAINRFRSTYVNDISLRPEDFIITNNSVEFQVTENPNGKSDKTSTRTAEEQDLENQNVLDFANMTLG